MIIRPKTAMSSVILSWNRKDLLEITLSSYVDTIGMPYELFVVDNGSTDGSAELIREFCGRRPSAEAILLEENVGGEAFNLGIERCSSPLVHLSDNDVEYLPGWSDRALELFETIPTLGQLSLYGPIALDTQVLGYQLPNPVYRSGELLYEPTGEWSNVPATSVIRRSVFDAGVRIYNFGELPSETGRKRSHPPPGMHFADDLTLSASVRKVGLEVLWADRYLVQDLGDCYEEVSGRSEYYAENWASKFESSTGASAARASHHDEVARWGTSPKPMRNTFLSPLWPDAPIMPDVTRSSPRCPQPRIWSRTDAWSPSVEASEFVYSLVRLLKPKTVLLVDAWRGVTASAAARALAHNDLGSGVAFEPDEFAFARLREALEFENSKSIRAAYGNFERAEIDTPIDMLLLHFRPTLTVTPGEMLVYFDALAPGAIVIAFNLEAATNSEELATLFEELVSSGAASAIWIDSPKRTLVVQCGRPVAPAPS